MPILHPFSRYPFHGQEHTGLFAKIRRGHFTLPESLSSRAKCLIRCLLRKEPADRITTEDVLIHPWLNTMNGTAGRERLKRSHNNGCNSYADATDQCVPERPPAGAKRAKTAAAAGKAKKL